jgi:hypothetical protein
MATDPGGESTPLLGGVSQSGDAHQTVPLLGLHSKEAHMTLTRLGRRISAIPSTFSLRRNSMRQTERIVPAMGKLGSFLFLSNLITGACVTGEGRGRTAVGRAVLAGGAPGAPPPLRTRQALEPRYVHLLRWEDTSRRGRSAATAPCGERGASDGSHPTARAPLPVPTQR